MKKRDLGFPLAETGDPVKPQRISVDSVSRTSNKQKGNKGKYKSESYTTSLHENLDGSKVAYMQTRNKTRGVKGRYKSKSIAVSKEGDGSYSLSKNKVRGMKGRYSERNISERTFNRKSEKLKEKYENQRRKKAKRTKR